MFYSSNMAAVHTLYNRNDLKKRYLYLQRIEISSLVSLTSSVCEKIKKKIVGLFTLYRSSSLSSSYEQVNINNKNN